MSPTLPSQKIEVLKLLEVKREPDREGAKIGQVASKTRPLEVTLMRLVPNVPASQELKYHLSISQERSHSWGQTFISDTGETDL